MQLFMQMDQSQFYAEGEYFVINDHLIVNEQISEVFIKQSDLSDNS